MTEPDRRRSLQPPYELQLMGGFRLSVHGCDVHVASSAQRLVAYLALQPRPVGRDQAAGALWLDAHEARAHANLRSAIWRVRREATDLLAADNGTLALAPEALVDIRTIVARARALFTDSAADEVDLTLFSGELLPDWFDDWVLAERERVRQVCLHGLDRLAAVFLARKEYPQAIDAALLAIRVDPLREIEPATAPRDPPRGRQPERGDPASSSATRRSCGTSCRSSRPGISGSWWP